MSNFRPDLFASVLRDLRRGQTVIEASEQLNELVNACRDTLKAGEIILKVKIKPDKSGNGQYFVSDEISTKIPKFDKGDTLLYGTPEGNLQRTDPQQGDIFETREISKPEAKTVATPTTEAKTVS